MQNFWDYSVWGVINLVAVLLLGLLFANILKRKIKILRMSLIPTSVLGGVLILLIAIIYKAITGETMLDTAAFNYSGMNIAEAITYHCLALGFIASVFKPNPQKLNRERTREIFDSGITTVATYLIQAIFGLGITILWARFIKPGFFAASGAILPFGYGQGTGQALNYGSIYESDYGFVGGKSFGLTIAALGFISAAIGGVIYLNILSIRKQIKRAPEEKAERYEADDIQGVDEIPMNGSIDKLTVQLVLIFLCYMLSYITMYALGNLIPSLKSVMYGFNFMFGVIFATILNSLLPKLRKVKAMNRIYVNGFLMKRLSGFFFDMMIVAGLAAIRVELVKQYWLIMLILGIVGAVITFLYTKLVARRLFPKYANEQFLGTYGMLTGTASTGIILLREIDHEFKTPAADNLVFQSLPAIVFGFPMMIIAANAPKNPVMVLIVCVAYFAVLNLILFRKQIFGKKNK